MKKQCSKEEPIGYLKFNDFVDQLVDDQFWLQRIDYFAKTNPNIPNNDKGKITDCLEGKVEVADGTVDYTELMNPTGTKLKSACYIASFTGLREQDFSNGKIRKDIADDLAQLAGDRNFALLEADIMNKKSTNSIVQAINDPYRMSPRLVDPKKPLGYLDSKGRNRHYLQQVIMDDMVLQNVFSNLSEYKEPENYKKEDPKYIASIIIAATSKEQATKLILGLGRKTIAGIIQKLPMEVSQKFIRNMDRKYIENLRSLLSPKKYTDLKKAWRCQLANQLEPNNLKMTMQFKAVEYTKEIIHEKRATVLKKAKKCEKYRNDLLKECIFKKPKEYDFQKEYRIVLVVQATKENQELPCVMNLQFYKQPLIPNDNGVMEFLQPIQTKKVRNCFIYNLNRSDLINLGKSITEDENSRVYPNVASKIPRKHL